MNRHFKTSIALLALLCALAAATSARAIERYAFRTLPHLGYGGEALGVPSFKPSTDNESTSGQVRDAQGRTHACLWRKSNGWALELLPGLGGPSIARCTDWGYQAGIVAAGSAETPGGIEKPMLWTGSAPDSFTARQLPTLGGARGVASALHYDNGDPGPGVYVVGASQNAAGDMRATLWRPTPTGFQAYDLGALGGNNSEAVALRAWDGDYGFDGVVAGSAETASGQRNACFWRIHDDGYPAEPIFVVDNGNPGGGLNSFFEDACGHGSHVVACGTATTATGRSIAFKEAWAEFIAEPLTVPNANNTAAYGCDGRTYGNLTIGEAWNDPAKRTAVVWNTIDSLGRTRVYPARELALDDYHHPLIRAVGPGIIAGSYLDTDNNNSPFALVADGTQLPDTVAVNQGIPESHFTETDLWHDGDGRTLRIRTQNSQGDRATVEISHFTSDDDPDHYSVNVRARALGGPDTTARITAQAWNFETGAWDSIGLGFCDDWTIAEFSAPPGHVNPVTGEVRVRLTFTPLSGNLRGVEVDSVVLTPVVPTP